MPTPEKLIETILTKPECADDGVLANQLLREFHRGFPIDALRPLLSSRNENVVRVGAFVASELGSKAISLLGLMVKLLEYPNRFIRSDAICSVLTCTNRNNQSEIAAVISMLDDLDWPIRWKTMEFLFLASFEQLRAGLQYFEKGKADSDHITGLRWLTNESGRNVDEISAWLRSKNAFHRKYGVVAAARIASVINKPLVLASSIEDDDVKRFADSMLRMKIEAKGNTQL